MASSFRNGRQLFAPQSRIVKHVRARNRSAAGVFWIVHFRSQVVQRKTGRFKGFLPAAIAVFAYKSRKRAWILRIEKTTCNPNLRPKSLRSMQLRLNCATLTALWHGPCYNPVSTRTHTDAESKATEAVTGRGV